MKRHLFSIVLILACAIPAVAQTGDLPRSTPEAEGVPPELLNSFYHRITSMPEVDIHHMMVLRHDKVISEWHATPYQADQLHMLYSASKTVTGLAVGLAVDDGLLTIDDKVSKFLRDKMPATLSPALDSLTVRDLLIMASGREQDLSIFMGEEDWLTTWFAGNFSGVGQHFNYDSMCTHALAVIVSRLTGKSLLDYVRERIFTPLHITRADWELAPDSVETAGWGLRLQTESEAKLGLLLLHGGEWNGQQIVSKQWVHDMTQQQILTRENAESNLSILDKILHAFRRAWHWLRAVFTGYDVDRYVLGYGYQTKSVRQPLVDSFFATGYGGQLIDVVPKLDLVVVVNGRAANYGDELNTIYYRLLEPLVKEKVRVEAPFEHNAIDLPHGDGAHPLESSLFTSTILLEDNLLGLKTIDIVPKGNDRVFTMTDWRGPLRAVAGWGEWRITTSDDRPIYIMESREQLVGTQRPFTTAAAYAWRGDTLAMRMDWLDGGDNRRLEMVFEGERVTVFANDNYDPLINDTIQGRIEIRKSN